MERQSGSRKLELDRWFDERFKHNSVFDLPEILDEALEFFSNPTWRQEYCEETMRERFKDRARRRIAATRPGGAIVTEHRVIAREEANRSAVVLDVQMGRWLEPIRGSQGRYSELREMYRPQLLGAIHARENRIKGEQKKIEYMKAIVAELPDDDTPVKEAIGEDRLQELWNDIVHEYGEEGEE